MSKFNIANLFIGLMLVAQQLPAPPASQSWDDSNTTSGHPPDGGDGVWNATNMNWSDPTFFHTIWAGNTAIFGGKAGTVDVQGALDFNELIFQTSGYHIKSDSGGSLIANSANSLISVAPGVKATISCALTTNSHNALLVEGGGALKLSGANTFTGTLKIEEGTTLNLPGKISLTNPNGLFQIGETTSYNHMNIKEGGSFTTVADVKLGTDVDAIKNTLTVEGKGTFFNVTDGNTLYVGDAGSYNSVLISSGGVVNVDKNTRIGNQISSINNRLTITDAGSRMNNTQSLYVGRNGSNNTLIVKEKGKLNVATALNPLTSLEVGYSGSNNQMIIESGGQVTVGSNLFIGDSVSISPFQLPANNSVLVTGEGSSLQVNQTTTGITGGIVIGVNGRNSSLTVSDNATVYAGLGIAIAANDVPVIGKSSGTLYIGTGGAPGTIIIPEKSIGIGPGQGDAKLVFNHNAPNYSFSPKLTDVNFLTYTNGILAVEHIGPGNTTLSAQNTYKGSLTIDQGTVAAGAVNTLSPNADILINRKGALNLGGFKQTVPSLTNHGVLDFGDSLTTLNVVDDFTQSKSGTLITSIKLSGKSDFISAGGKASLNGTLLVLPKDGVSVTSVYHLLHADSGVKGKFSQFLFANPLVKSQITYEPKDVFFSFQPNLAAAANTHNECAVATQLDNAQEISEDLGTVLNTLVNLPVEEARRALNNIAGEQYTYLVQLDRTTNEAFNQRIFNAVRNALSPYQWNDPCKPLSTWLQLEGGQYFARKDRNSRGLSTTNWDVSLGAFLNIDSQYLLGAAANYQNSDVDFHEGGKTHWNTAQGALYGAYRHSYGYFLADLMYGESWGQVKRTIAFGSLNRRAISNPTVIDVLGYVEGGGNLLLGLTLVQPYIGFEAGSYHQRGFHEKDADSLNLKVKERTTTTYDTYLGAHLTRNCYAVMLSADLAWQHRYNRSNVFTNTAFEEFGDSFAIHGTELGRDSIRGALNVSRVLPRNITLYGQVIGEVWNRWASYGVEVGLNAKI